MPLTVLLGTARFVTPSALALDYFDAAVETAGNDVPIVQKRIFLKSDIDESRFQAVFEIAHPAFVNAAHEPLIRSALNGELLQLAFLQHAHARLERFGIDNDFLVDFLWRLH